MKSAIRARRFIDCLCGELGCFSVYLKDGDVCPNPSVATLERLCCFDYCFTQRDYKI